MARKRDNNSPTNLSLTTLLQPPPEVSPSTFDLVRQMAFREIEDARQYHPDPEAMPQTVKGPARITDRRVSARGLVSSAHNVMGFVNNPANPVIHCLRRKIRKEVLFAFNKTRKGARGRKHRNWKSNYRC